MFLRITWLYQLQSVQNEMTLGVAENVLEAILAIFPHADVDENSGASHEIGRVNLS